jgi:cellobiose phosphorylase
MYHFLTGSASWLVLTELTQVFGVRGWRGDLVLAPQLVKEEFNKKGIASTACQFAGHRLTVEYHNPQKLDAGKYAIKEVSIGAAPLSFQRLKAAQILIPRASITENSLIRIQLA